ncbi:MAG: molybdopterin molybdotransferase MoeA [Proteobacteria bacterium]|jgi:molybdopterin molybdotransferase|nr:molybdopterin molybdotransferase MoeA [Pseudomonadota bacterium]
MKEFFRVVSWPEAVGHRGSFPVVGGETVSLAEVDGRVLVEDIVAPKDLPGFRRSTMDGFAVRAGSTFGVSIGSPALFDVIGSVAMGCGTDLVVRACQAARILTGGMLPRGADAVVMVEHTEALDESTIEVSKSVAPGQNVIEANEDASAGQVVLLAGTRVRPQEAGLLAAMGRTVVSVRRRPVVAILSTGDEVVPPAVELEPGQIRDVNSTTLAAMVERVGGIPQNLGIVGDDFDRLLAKCRLAVETADVLLISGGSSVGSRDLTIEVISQLARAEVLFHGVAIKPGKPTILAKVGSRAVWGLPGHVASAMVVFRVLVQPMLRHISGQKQGTVGAHLSAKLSRNVPSVHGRVDFVRVRLEKRNAGFVAVPVPGRSGLLKSLVQADGLVEIERDSEGLDDGSEVVVQLF